MNRKTIFITLVLIFSTISLLSYCQNNDVNQDKDAERQIVRFDNKSVLLVRLQTKEKSIEAYRNAGRTKTADKIEIEQKEKNQRILNAFSENFNFCPVYFFFSNQSLHILHENYDSIIFVNDKLENDPNINPKLSSFLIAEFGVVQSDSETHYEGFSLEPDGNFSAEATSNSYGGAYTGLSALILKDKNFKQLRKPFPYYAKIPFFSSKNKSEEKTVKRLNRNLHNYYN